jgi:hypothetical protein
MQYTDPDNQATPDNSSSLSGLADLDMRLLRKDVAFWIEQSDTWKKLASAERDRADRAEAALVGAWDQGVNTALNYAIRNEDGVTLRLEHLDGSPWVNPYRSEATA